MTPKDIQILITGTLGITLYGKRIFVCVINDLDMRLSWVIELGPKYNHKYLYKRKARGDLTIEKAAM